MHTCACTCLYMHPHVSAHMLMLRTHVHTRSGCVLGVSLLGRRPQQRRRWAGSAACGPRQNPLQPSSPKHVDQGVTTAGTGGRGALHAFRPRLGYMYLKDPIKPHRVDGTARPAARGSQRRLVPCGAHAGVRPASAQGRHWDGAWGAGEERRRPRAKPNGNSHPLLNCPLIGFFLRNI